MNSCFHTNLGIVEPITLYDLVTVIVNHLGHKSLISTLSDANEITVTNTLPKPELQHDHVASTNTVISDNAGFTVTNDIATINEVNAVPFDTEIANVNAIGANDADTYGNVIDDFRNKKVSSYHSDDKISEVTNGNKLQIQEKPDIQPVLCVNSYEQLGSDDDDEDETDNLKKDPKADEDISFSAKSVSSSFQSFQSSKENISTIWRFLTK